MADLYSLQEFVRNPEAFSSLRRYFDAAVQFLEVLADTRPTRIVSPTEHDYIFFQFGEDFGYTITRPLNTEIFCQRKRGFSRGFNQLIELLADLSRKGPGAARMRKHQKFVAGRGIERVVYTIQQSIGSIGDTFENANQARKRVGMLFELLIMLLIKEVGLECESRRVNIELPGCPGYAMSYELDLVISREKAIVTSETSLIGTNEVVGSVKTTSKDRIDKVFLDKFMLSKLLGRTIPVIAIFLHDVQRAKKQGSIFGINSTFKSNHFLGYCVALTRLDDVYYVDPRPNMITDERLSRQVSRFSKFLTEDLWALTEDR